MKAILKNYRQAPRKIRLITNLIKGMPVEKAQRTLELLVKRGSLPIKKLLDSAVANAVQTGKVKSNLFIKTATTDSGLVLKRMMPRARGSAYQILKKNSHVVITLGEK
jgi:large subunit ribosomal protein L22